MEELIEAEKVSKAKNVAKGFAKNFFAVFSRAQAPIKLSFSFSYLNDSIVLIVALRLGTL